jgi:hypothetical protein
MSVQTIIFLFTSLPGEYRTRIYQFMRGNLDSDLYYEIEGAPGTITEPATLCRNTLEKSYCKATSWLLD